MSAVQQVLSALEAAFNPNPEARQAGQAHLNHLKQTSPELYFPACLEILITPSCSLIGRELSGFEIKNNLNHPSCGKNASIATSILQVGITDPERKIRKVSSSIVSRAVREALWPAPTVLQQLCAVLSSSSSTSAAIHGAVLAISKVVDDCIILLDAQEATGGVVQAVLPFLSPSASLTNQEALEVRLKALEIMEVILEQAGMDFDSVSYRSTQPVIFGIIQACFSNLENPPSNALAAKSISCIVLSLAHENQINDSMFYTILQLMEKATTQEGVVDEELRMAAVEFWRAVLHFPRFAQLSAPSMTVIIPTLIRFMIYSDMEIGMLSGSANDWQEEDKEDEIRPRHFQSKMQTTNDEDDDDGDENDEVEKWNLRRVAARTLDDISAYYGEPVLDPALQAIMGWMNSEKAMSDPKSDWKYVEAACLAFGAITEGCLHSMSSCLPSFSSHFISLIQNPETHFLVVCISLWCCEQIIEFFVSPPGNLLDSLIKVVLSRMQNPSKKVQESATSALSTLVEKCTLEQLEPYTLPISKTISECLQGFQLKNRLLLLESFGLICEKLSPVLRENDEAVGLLLAPLSKIWISTPDNSIFLFSIFECMSSVCGSLGPVLPQDTVSGVFQRAFSQLQLHLASLEKGDDEDAAEFVVTAADLISGLVDGLGSSIEPYVAQSREVFFRSLFAMLNNQENANVRQSGFCLCGDIGKAFPTYLQSVLPHFSEALAANLSEATEHNYRVISNAAWAVCNLLENELAIQNLPTLAGSSYLDKIYAMMAKILVTTDITVDMRNMADNISLLLGQSLAMDPDVERRSGCPASYFSRRFCEYVRNMKTSLSQKTLALNGYIRAMSASPQEGASHVYLILDLAASMSSEPPDTLAAMTVLLQKLAQINPNSWSAALQQCRAQQKNILRQAYGIGA